MTDGHLHDVAVVGGGPVGLVLAGLLARRGADVIVLERDHDVYALPRAAHLDHEILRILQELGCVDELLTGMRANVGMDFLTADHQVLLSIRSPGVTVLGWPASVFFHQPSFDRRLREVAVECGATLRTGVEVEGIDTGHDDRVVVHLADGGTVSARYAVGCDGARSITRKVLDVELDDLQFDEPWLVVDLLVESGREHLPDVVLQVSDPARPHTVVPMPEPRFRFEFMLLPGEDAEAMQRPERVHELLAPWFPDGGAHVERSAVYTFHGLIASPWRRGRVLLAGDAAHQMPPFLGQGMCSGLRDAANLAWKLDAVLHGGDESLLDTYETEREPHVRAIVETAVAFGRIICTLDPDQAAQRDAMMLAQRAADDTPTTSAAMPPLTAGLLGPGGGAVAPQPWLDGRRFDDVVGQRFAVIGRHPSSLADGGAWWADRGACLLDAVTHPELVDLLDHAGADVLVVRPDRYVLASGDDLAPITDLVRPYLTPR